MKKKGNTHGVTRGLSLKQRIQKAFNLMPSVSEQEALEKTREIEKQMEGNKPSK